MKEEKNINTGKQENQSQDQFAAERLIDDELENVAGGADNPFPFPPPNPIKYEVPPPNPIKDEVPLPNPFEGHCH